MDKVNIYELDGIWVTAANVKDAIKVFEDIGYTIDELFEGNIFLVEILDDHKLNRYIYEREDSTSCSFAERLKEMIAEGEKFPALFAADSTY